MAVTDAGTARIRDGRRVYVGEQFNLPSGTPLSATAGNSRSGSASTSGTWTVKITHIYYDGTTMPTYCISVQRYINGSASGGSGVITWSAYTKAVAASMTKVTNLSGNYKILSVANQSYCLNIADNSTANKGNAETTAVKSNTSQIWHLSQSSGYYTIKNSRSGLVLDVNGGSMSSAANVDQYTSNNTDAQKWEIYSYSGSYYIVCKKSWLALDIHGGTPGNGTNVQQYYPNNSNAQLWKIVPAYYTISYVNGAISGWTMPSAPASQTKEYGVTLTLRGALSNATRSFTDTANLDANGGSSTGDSDNKLTGTRSLKRTFSKWGSYTAGASYTANAAATLTASWGAAALNSASTVTLPTPATRAGYAFNGWYTASSGGSKVGNAGASVTLSNSTSESAQTVTWHAQWTAYVLTVHYHANGGTMLATTNYSDPSIGSDGLCYNNGDPCSNTYTYPNAVDLADGDNPSWLNLSKTGYNLKPTLNWRLGSATGTEMTEDGGIPITTLAPDIITGNRTIIVYANWVKASAPIYIKINGVYKEGTPYIKVNGVYQEGSAYIKQNGTWVQ